MLLFLKGKKEEPLTDTKQINTLEVYMVITLVTFFNCKTSYVTSHKNEMWNLKRK